MIPLASPTLGDAERENLSAVLERGQLARGPECRAFESSFAAYCGTEHAVATSNGTTALHAGLHALGVGPGDAVVTTPFSFVATANAIRLTGAEVVFADVDPTTYTIDPAAVERACAERDDVAAVLAVHLYGVPADMRALSAIAAEHDVALVEDAAQAHGATDRGERAGSIGDLGTFSFYPTKNMTTGEGGAVVTDDDALADAVRRFTDHGRAGPDTHVEVGHNFRMPDLAAAVGRAQLARLPSFTRARRANAAALTEALATVEGVHAPVEPERARHVFHQYTVRCERRDALAAHLAEAGVGTGVYYPTPIHRQPAYDRSERYPVAERLAGEVLSVPVHPGVDEEARRTVAAALRSFDGTERTTRDEAVTDAS